MFGFIRPAKSELRVREVERFKHVYCGLCHTIRARYGRIYTFFLSYDMTFLALLLLALEEEDSGTSCLRCDASPIRKKEVSKPSPALDRAADISVLLQYYKICDSVQDERGIKRAAAKFLRALCAGDYRRAKEQAPDLDHVIEGCLAELQEIEQARTPSIDRAADPFARLLSACVADAQPDNDRALKELFYHIGRWIYLIDACADIQEDFDSGDYNPVALRYELPSPDLSPVREPLELTLSRSLVAVYSAFQLLDLYRDRELLENIICLGLPLVTKQVLDGTFEPNGGQSRHGSL